MRDIPNALEWEHRSFLAPRFVLTVRTTAIAGGTDLAADFAEAGHMAGAFGYEGAGNGAFGAGEDVSHDLSLFLFSIHQPHVPPFSDVHPSSFASLIACAGVPAAMSTLEHPQM